MDARRGTFITFEGGEGAGKSTQLRMLGLRLDELGIGHVDVREPGGTKVSEHVRAILLDPELTGFSPRAELCLYEGARSQIVDEIIEPALASGENVLCDRFYDSSTAYQGFGRRLDLETILALNGFAANKLVPDRTIYLDIEPELGLSRATIHSADRLEAEDIEFHHLVREGFWWIAQREPDRFKVIDASRSTDEVHALVLSELMPLFGSGCYNGDKR